MGKFLSEIQDQIVESLQGNVISFIMGVQDTCTVPNMGTVVTGTIGSGFVKIGDVIEVIAQDGSRFMVRVIGLEREKKLIDIASKGDAVGILFPVRREGVLNVGDLLIKIDNP